MFSRACWRRTGRTPVRSWWSGPMRSLRCWQPTRRRSGFAQDSSAATSSMPAAPVVASGSGGLPRERRVASVWAAREG
jgi:hypothetical protein